MRALIASPADRTVDRPCFESNAIRFITSRISRVGHTCERQDKSARGIVTVRKEVERPDAVCDTDRGTERLRHRREDPVAAPEEEDGPGRTRAAHRAVAGDALENRARPAVPDAADAAAHRAGLQRRARVLLRRRPRKAARSRSSGRINACGCPNGPAPSRRRIGSSRSTTRRPSAVSTPTTPNSFRSRRMPCGRTPIPAPSSSTRWPARSSVHIDGDEHALEAGDSMYFDSSIPHAYRRRGGRTCSAIVVTTG